MKIAIIADNHKVKMFKKELSDNNFDEVVISESSVSKDISNIIVHTDESRQNEVKKICMKVELHFKQGN